MYFDPPSKFEAIFSPTFRDIGGRGLSPLVRNMGGGVVAPRCSATLEIKQTLILISIIKLNCLKDECPVDALRACVLIYFTVYFKKRRVSEKITL